MGAGVAMVAGLVILAFAADWFVVGAARLASALNVPAVVVGVVIVGFGTSAPEMVVSVLASLDGDTALAVGNITGSNLANLTLVLGLAACAGTIAVSSSTIRREAPVSTAAVCLFALCALVGLDTATGLVLLTALVLAGAVILRAALTARATDEADLEAEVAELEDGAADTGGRANPLVQTVIGLLGTLLGAHFVVSGAVGVAGLLGLSQGFVGLTLVAVGTSLPEIITAVQAVRRGEDELVVGNVLGSNLFNSLAAGGIVALTGHGFDGSDRLPWALGTMVAAALATGVAMAWRKRLTRMDAAVLLTAYAATVPVLSVT